MTNDQDDKLDRLLDNQSILLRFYLISKTSNITSHYPGSPHSPSMNPRICMNTIHMRDAPVCIQAAAG